MKTRSCDPLSRARNKILGIRENIFDMREALPKRLAEVDIVEIIYAFSLTSWEDIRSTRPSLSQNRAISLSAHRIELFFLRVTPARIPKYLER